MDVHITVQFIRYNLKKMNLSYKNDLSLFMIRLHRPNRNKLCMMRDSSTRLPFIMTMECNTHKMFADDLNDILLKGLYDQILSILYAIIKKT